MTGGRAWLLGAVLVLLSTGAWAWKDKDKEPSGQLVDSGAFGVFMNGRRVATETFKIQQSSKGNTATAEFRTEGTDEKAVQTSELQMATNGSLVRYEWKEVSPGKSGAVVVPTESFLTERYVEGAGAKEQEHPFLLPVTSSVLDDYFFSQREILLWKFLATSCRQQNGKLECPANQKTKFGTINPHARSSLMVTLEFVGREKVPIRGVEMELNRFDLKSDAGDWSIWMNDQFKVMRILIESDKTEVLRD